MLTVYLVTPPQNGTVVLNPDGSFTYTPNADYADLDSLEYQVCDNGASFRCDTAWVYFTIEAVNDAPTITILAIVMVDEDVPTPLTGISFSDIDAGNARSEEHTSELQSLMRISYDVFCLKKLSYQHIQ